MNKKQSYFDAKICTLAVMQHNREVKAALCLFKCKCGIKTTGLNMDQDIVSYQFGLIHAALVG